MNALARVRQAVEKRGVVGAAAAGLREIVDRVTSSYEFNKVLYSGRTFHFQGKSYGYVIRRYASAWRSERVVEIPIVWDVVQQYSGRRILEVGNVLAHYYPVTHDCVDKYEKAPRVLNEDIVDFKSDHPYDLVVSISTLEHVGWDEMPREPEKILRAVETLVRVTAPGGRIMVTLPMAYNPHVDTFLKDGRLSFTRLMCLKRISRNNRWEETSWSEAASARFDTPFRRVNAVVVGVIERANA